MDHLITGYSGMDKEAALYVLSYVAKNFISIMLEELRAIECWKDSDTSKIIVTQYSSLIS